MPWTRVGDTREAMSHSQCRAIAGRHISRRVCRWGVARRGLHCIWEPKSGGKRDALGEIFLLGLS